MSDCAVFGYIERCGHVGRDVGYNGGPSIRKFDSLHLTQVHPARKDATAKAIKPKRLP